MIKGQTTEVIYKCDFQKSASCQDEVQTTGASPFKIPTGPLLGAAGTFRDLHVCDPCLADSGIQVLAEMVS